jgi:hypothetical protein
VLTWWLAEVAAWGASVPLGEVGIGHAAVVAVAFAVALGRRRRGRPGAGWPAAVLAVAVVVATSWGRPVAGDGPAPLGGSTTLWVGGGGSVLLVDGPVDASRLLEELRRAGARCVDAVAVAGGGPAAAVVASALVRRCSSTAVLAPAGRAHPGWTAMAPGSAVRVGTVLVAVTTGGDLAVSRAPPATFPSMTPATDLPPLPGDDDLRRLAEAAARSA